MCLGELAGGWQGPAGTSEVIVLDAPAPAYIAPRTPTPYAAAHVTTTHCTISSCRVSYSTCNPSSAFKKGTSLRGASAALSSELDLGFPPVLEERVQVGVGHHDSASMEVTAPSGVAVVSAGRRRAGISPRPMTIDPRRRRDMQDAAFDISVYLDSVSEQYCVNEDDITGLVILHCPTTTEDEVSGSVLMKQASVTIDHEAYDIPFANCDASIPLFDASVQALSALADVPMYSRHSSFRDGDCHETLALAAEAAV